MPYSVIEKPKTKTILGFFYLFIMLNLYVRRSKFRSIWLMGILFYKNKSNSYCLCHQRTEFRPAHMLNTLPTTAAKIHHILISGLSGRDTDIGCRRERHKGV